MAVDPALDVVERYVSALASFGRHLGAVSDHEWENATPCADWNVQHVLAHVVVGESQLAPVVAGEPVTEVDDVDPRVVGTNPMASWRGTALAAIAAARQPNMASTVFSTGAGDIEGRVLLGLRIAENVIHGWDIAVATQAGAGESSDSLIDAEMAEWLLEFWRPVGLRLAATDHFATAIEPASAATAPDRLLALVGRTSPQTAPPPG